MKTYVPTIGLEVHAELKTQTKMFCDSLNNPDETRPNVNVCPICMGFPGTLPVVNKEAVHQVLRMGAAMGGTLADYTEFDRKNYFYPDLPIGYQISQFEFPLVKGGALAGVQLTRIHLEEDAARSQHDADKHYSLIDFNRAGLPLMELVTEPVIHDAKTASFFAQELQRLLRALGAGEANMEKGQMRVEANVSVAPEGEPMATDYVEVKNINSFRAAEKAIAYEIERQTALLEKGETVVKETRGWDENTGTTYSQRLKEGSHDYRYFPDPDIPKFRLSRIDEFSLQNIVSSLPELPWKKRERYAALGLKSDDIETLVADPVYSEFFDREVSKEYALLGANYLFTDVRGAGATTEGLTRLSGGVFNTILRLAQSGDVSSRGAKDLIILILKEGGEPESLAKERGLLQMKDLAAISAIAEEVIAENTKIVTEIKAGKEEGLKFLIGQGMKKSKGSADPLELEKALRKHILN